MINPLIGLMFDLQWSTTAISQVSWTDIVPQYGTDLWYHMQLRSAAAGASDNLAVLINGDTVSAHYHGQGMRFTDGTVLIPEGTNSTPIYLAGGASPADSFASIMIHIQGFRSARQKVAHCFSFYEENATVTAVRWVAHKRHGAGLVGLITDPVTSVTFQAFSGGAVLTGTMRRAIS